MHKFYLRCSALKDKQNIMQSAVPKIDLEIIEFIKSIPVL